MMWGTWRPKTYMTVVVKEIVNSEFSQQFKMFVFIDVLI